MLGVFKKKAELPEYLSHYGMYRAPFSASIEDDMYYADPVRQQRLDILLHLTQNTHELLVIIGEDGIGKTTFLNQFLHSAAEHWKICFLEGHKMMAEEQFLERVYMGFNIAHASVHKGTMLSNLRKRLETMLENAIPVILVIDNAQLFSTKVLSLVLEIASVKNTKTGSSVRVILSSEPQIKIMLAEPTLDDAHNLIIRKIDLPPLDEIQTGNYLHHRLTQAGMMTEQFLTKSTISKIFKKSDGVPRRINEEADKLLFETTPIIRRNSNIQSDKHSPGLTLLIIIAIIVFAGIAAFLFFDEEKNIHVGETTEPVEETTTSLKLPPAKPVADSSRIQEPQKNKEEQIDPMQLLKDELASKSTTHKNEGATQLTSDTAGNENEAAPRVTLPQLKIADKPANENAISSPTDDTSRQVNSVNSLPANNTDAKLPDSDNSELKDSNWVMQQNAEHYTLQLVAGLHKTTITNFIKKYKLSGELIYFNSSRNGKVWHNLTYGIYPNQKTAHAAIKKLPSSLSSVKPWTRQLKTIQAEIKKLPRQ